MPLLTDAKDKWSSYYYHHFPTVMNIPWDAHYKTWRKDIVLQQDFLLQNYLKFTKKAEVVK